MSMTIQGGISPEEIIAFIQEHTEDYASQIKGEMQAAEDRTSLVGDLARLAGKLQELEAGGQLKSIHAELEAFLSTHEQTWGGREHDITFWLCNAQAWRDGCTMVDGTYEHENHPDATDGASSFCATFDQTQNLDDPNVRSGLKDMVKSWVDQLNNWKDEVSSDDKIGMMKLQENADRLANLYKLGSNLVSNVDGCASSIIANIGRA
jgi:hypothetical protein